MRALGDMHERIVEAPADQVGVLLDRLAGPDDPLLPTPAWPAMRLDGPPAVGVEGAHGPIRCSVGAYEPGRRLRFDLAPPAEGRIELTVEPLDAGRCRVRHSVHIRASRAVALAWKLVARSVYDTVAGELLDNVEHALIPGGPARPARWSRRARLVNRLLWERATEAEVPAGAKMARTAFHRTDFADAWQMSLRSGMARDPRAWSDVLWFPFLDASDDELLLGMDLWHLDFRVSTLLDQAAGTVTFTSVVKLNNLAGRLYFSVVRLGHPRAVRHVLRRAHRRLALATSPAGVRHRERAAV